MGSCTQWSHDIQNGHSYRYFFNYTNKKLSYNRGTVQSYMLVSSCYVSRGMAVTNVSVSKNDHQSQSRALSLVPIDRPHMIFY